MTLLLLAPLAHAGLGDTSSGVWLDAHGGLSVDGAAGPGWTAGIGGWFGRADDAMAISRRCHTLDRSITYQKRMQKAIHIRLTTRTMV